MQMDWEHEQTIIKEKHEILRQKLEEAKLYKKNAEEKHKTLMDEKDTHNIQVQAQSLEKAKLIEDNKKAKIEFLRNEETMIEYQTLTFKQSKKIQELKDEISASLDMPHVFISAVAQDGITELKDKIWEAIVS